jgi:hypothetical protein
MPSKEQTSLIQLQGGLDTIADRVTLFQTPGKAVKMINFESGLKGGYRRIDGYTKYSAITPDGVGTDPVVTARSYRNGCIAVQGGNVYFSKDGTSWLQVNKDTSGAFVSETTMPGLTALPRISNGVEHYRFEEFNNGIENELFIVDTQGVNPLARLVIKGDATFTYKYEEAGATEWGTGNVRYPTMVTAHNERLVVSGDPAYKNEVYYSDLEQPFDFVGGGVINVSDVVVWCETFRENLIIFGKGLLKAVAGLGDPSLQNIETITSKIGCVAGGSVQEVAGGLLFLAHDGLRTVGATDRIDDFELGVVTTDIKDEVLDIVAKADTSYITSTVIRSRNQYRLFISDNLDPLKGIGGVIRGQSSDAAGLAFEWNTFQGNSLYDVSSIRNDDNQETIYQVNASSYVYTHNEGSTFDGTNITAVFKTADMMFGDPNYRKTLQSIDTYINIEGITDISLQVIYDEPFGRTASPGVYGTDASGGLTVYDVAIYDTDTYDTVEDIIETTPLQGSGKLVSFIYQSNGASAPFTIQAMNVSYLMNGRF